MSMEVGDPSVKMLVQAQGLIRNLCLDRASLVRQLTGQCRDYDKEFGYPTVEDSATYMDLFRRGDIANRIVRIYPDDCWAVSPEVTEDSDPKKETTFEKQWLDLVKRTNAYHFLHRVDMLSGIGRYGCLYMGYDDVAPGGGSLKTPVRPGDASKPRNLLFLRAFDESLVEVADIDGKEGSVRQGLPEFYNVQFADTTPTTTTRRVSGVYPTDRSGQSTRVHWSRILHVADNRLSSEIYGCPRLESVFRRVYDLHKLAGGSAEMYYKGALMGLAFEIPADVAAEIDTDDEEEKKKFRTEVSNYFEGLQRYLALKGYTAKNLAPQIASPIDHVMAQLHLIAIAIGCPLRMLMGSEEARLASNQDTRSWNKKLHFRDLNYLDPMLLGPFVQHQIMVGAVSSPAQFMSAWPDRNAPTDEDRADVAQKQTDAITTFVQGGGLRTMGLDEYLSYVIGFPQNVVQAMVKSADPKAEIPNTEKKEQGIRGRDATKSGESKK